MDLFANIRVFTAEIFLFFFIRVWSKWTHPLCWKLHVIKKIVGKNTRKQPERYCIWFWVDCSSKKFKRMTLKAMDVCLGVLKESSKSKFDRCNVRNSVYWSYPILLFGFVAWNSHFYSDNVSRKSCISYFVHSSCSSFSESLRFAFYDPVRM